MRTKHVALLALLLLLPWLNACTESEAWMGPIMMGGGVESASTNFCDDQSGYLICEDFEGDSSCESGSGNSNCRNTWLAGVACGNAVNYAYATSLDGTYSAYFAESTNGDYCSKITPNFTASSSVYSVARLKLGVLTIDAESESAYLLNIDGRCRAWIAWDGDSTQFAVDDGANNFNYGTTTTPASGTEYYLWLEFIQNTSCKLYVSTTGTKPGSAEATTNGPNITVDSFLIYCRDWGTEDADEIIFDNILVDDAVIGSQ